MRKVSGYTKVLLISLLLLFPGCNGNDPAVSLIDFPEGNCIGKVSNANGALISGASVLLVPEGYTPLAGSSGQTEIASTVSDEQGRYAFNVEKTGVYNLLAEGKNQYGMRTAIKVSTSSRMELTAQVLRDPGSLTGVVQLHSADDHSSAVILLPGTNKYAVPSDKSGHFTFPALAEGNYKIRMMSTMSDYAVVDTTITIVAGEETVLPITVLQEKKQAHITQFTAAYDSLMMEVNLLWQVDDPALVDSFAVFCNREKNILPILKTSASVVHVKIDVLSLYGDTLVYQVAAIGKEKWLSEPAVANPVVARIGFAVKMYKPSLIDIDPSLSVFGWSWYINNGFIYDSNIKRENSFELVKADTTWKVIDHYTLPEYVDIDYNSPFCFDHNGNVFILVDSLSNAFILKFNKDLHLLGRLTLPAHRPIKSIAVSSEGYILVFQAISEVRMDMNNQLIHADSTYITKYDIGFNIISDSVVYGVFKIDASYCHGQTVMTSIYRKMLIQEAVNRSDSNAVLWSSGNIWFSHEVVLFDATFNNLRSIELNQRELIGLAPGNLFCLKLDDHIQFLNEDNNVVVRMPNNCLRKDYIIDQHAGIFYAGLPFEEYYILELSLPQALVIK